MACASAISAVKAVSLSAAVRARTSSLSCQYMAFASAISAVKAASLSAAVRARASSLSWAALTLAVALAAHDLGVARVTSRVEEVPEGGGGRGRPGAFSTRIVTS